MRNPGSQLLPAVLMACESVALFLETTILPRPKPFDRSIASGRKCLVAVADQNSKWKRKATADIFDSVSGEWETSLTVLKRLLVA